MHARWKSCLCNYFLIGILSVQFRTVSCFFGQGVLPEFGNEILDTALDILDGGLSENQWNPASSPDRHDLECLCSDDDPEESVTERCCSCHASPVWEGTEIDLNMEYVSGDGKALLLSSQTIDETKVYKVIHTGGKLRHLPSNLCNWDTSDRLMKYTRSFNTFQPFWTRLVKMDFRDNDIENLPNINCLTNLDYLNLNHNSLKHVPNTSFTELSRLRYLYLGNNNIVTLDSGITMAPSMHLTHIDLSTNQLSTLDITNIISQYPFCEFDFSSNKINKLTNELNVSFNCSETCSKSYGPGFVSFTDNIFETFPDFKALLGLGSIAQLGQLINFGFDFRNIKVKCDCVFAPLIELAKDFVMTHWRDYMNVTCHAPPHLAGIPVVNVGLDDFVCDLGREDNCPATCKCTDQPSINAIIVVCSNRDITELPTEMPTSVFSDFLEIHLDGNPIREVRNTSYFDQIRYMNLSNCQLESIEENAAEALTNASLDLSYNTNLRVLPQSLQFRNMCQIHLHGLLLECNCDSKWMSSWFSVKQCNGLEDFRCRVPEHGIMAAEEFSSDLLECNEIDKLGMVLAIIIGCLLILVAIVGLLLIYFKYEILILIIRLIRRPCKQTRVHPGYTFDAYLSFDQEDDQLRQWVGKILLGYLESSGYKVFYPPRDLTFGDVISTNTITAIQNSKTFVLILSGSYVAHEERCWIDEEWKFGWNMFKSDSRKKIILINYGHVSTFQIDHSQIKAFLRVGGQVSFNNYNGDIMGTIQTKLGHPCSRSVYIGDEENEIYDMFSFRNRCVFENAKPIFRMKSNTALTQDFNDIIFREKTTKETIDRLFSANVAL